MSRVLLYIQSVIKIRGQNFGINNIFALLLRYNKMFINVNSRSPDLSSLDFYLLEHLKFLIQIDNEDIQRFFVACETIRNRSGIFERMQEIVHDLTCLCVYRVKWQTL